MILASGPEIQDIVLPGTTLEVAETSLPPKSWKTLEDLEKDHIMEALAWCNYRVSGKDGAAVLLGITPAILTAKMKKLGIVKHHSSQ